jgi:DNA primase
VPSDPVELTKQIKAASDIVAVVGSYLALKPAGTIFKALCPFHNDTNPSLTIDPKRQRYKCWACGAVGDVFAFVQHMEKVGFTEARAILAARAGIKLDQAHTPQEHHRSRLLQVMRWAQSHYQRALLDEPVGRAAVNYIASRKFSGKTVRDFGLGFAPLAGDWLVKLAAAESIPPELLVEVGLIAPRQEGRGYYDRFRDRVMFPIKDVRGQVIGFGGRILPESPFATRGPKYYNSAETPLFSKSDVLYGLDLARHAGTAAGYLAVVEGYTDVIMAHQCGIPQVVATMGTALNARHVNQLRRFVPRVVLVFDADTGGLTGVDRALELFVSQDVELAVATLPEGLDPCDLLVRPGGVDAFKEVLASAVNALDFKLNRLLERDPAASIETTRRVVDDVLGIMAAAPALPSQAAQVKRELMITRLAARLKLRQETLWARLNELRAQRRQKELTALQKGIVPPAPIPPAGPPETRADSRASVRSSARLAAEKQLLELLLAHPGYVSQASVAITPGELVHSGIQRLVRELYALQAEGRVPDLDGLRERLSDRPDLFEAAQERYFIGQYMQDPGERLQRLLKWFAEARLQAEQRAVKEQLAAATEEQAVELLRKLQETSLRTKAGTVDDAARH